MLVTTALKSQVLKWGGVSERERGADARAGTLTALVLHNPATAIPRQLLKYV